MKNLVIFFSKCHSERNENGVKNPENFTDSF